MQLAYVPTLDRQETERRLELLLFSGSVADSHLEGRIARLASRFRSYAGSYPLPLWAPGLKIVQEMTGLTEALLPMAEVRAVFDLVLRRGCRFNPFLHGTYLHTSPSWLHFLDRLRPQLTEADPSAILGELARDGASRRIFLFSLMLPHHFGGAFDRYPQQTAWIRDWLTQNSGRLNGGVRALDSACGSGEGTYGLVEDFAAAGYDTGIVHGSTVESVELFSAAHAFFPHDGEREREYRARVAPLLAEGGMRIEFYLDDVAMKKREGEYDLVLCNGLLGGPLMHEASALDGAVRALVSRLAPGGVLLAADRFHAGWRQRVPAEMLRSLLLRHGLTPVEVPEGVGGVKAC